VKASDLGVEYKRTKTERLFLNLKLAGDYDQDDIIISEDRKPAAPSPPASTAPSPPASTAPCPPHRGPDDLDDLDGPDELEDAINPLS
jgi:hypothetical protein